MGAAGAGARVVIPPPRGRATMRWARLEAAKTIDFAAG